MSLPPHFELVAPRAGRAKAMGAYYTDRAVADFLVRWAVRRATDTALDPSFGGGVFVQAACRRIMALGGDPAAQVFGVEVDASVHADLVSRLGEQWEVRPDHFLRSDFFDVSPAHLNVDAVIGNPPFIRYHRFTGEARKKALSCARLEGVRLSALSSSWAPFVVHSVAVTRAGGRLAMVLPFELGYAAYARPVLELLCRRFRRVTLLTFRRRLFQELSEDTLLVLADERGGAFEGLYLRDLPGPEALDALEPEDRGGISGAILLDADALARGEARLMEAWLPLSTRALYQALKAHPRVFRLGELADVGIGYVTGANAYFHPSDAEIRRFHIPRELLRPAVRRARALRGLRLTERDWRSACETGDAGFLLAADDRENSLKRLMPYLRYGEAQGVQRAYKCRVREPWYQVPHVYRPDAFLTYMSGTMPRVVANGMGAVAPNTLHILRMHPGAPVDGEMLAALWLTSLSWLSAELEGHALGGGMLKLEPSEAEAVRVAVPAIERSAYDRLIPVLDERLRAGHAEEARALADREVLRAGLELSEADCRSLMEGAQILYARRVRREGITPGEKTRSA